MSGSYLVTGAGGFLGRWAVAGLRNRGRKVIAALSPKGSPPFEIGDTPRVHVDLLEAEAARRLIAETQPECVVHFAWDATPGGYWTTPDNWRWLAATILLAQQHFEAGGKRFVLASTCAEYDWSKAGICVEGQTPTVLADTAIAKPYSLCKAMACRTIAGMAQVYGGTAACGRIFFQYGPYEHRARLAPTVIRALLARERVETSHGRQIRDFLHASDVGDAFAAIAVSSCDGAINIGAGNPVSLGEFIGEIARQIGRPDLVALGARSAAEGDPPILRPDVTRLYDEVGWRPSYRLTEGISETIDWWRQQEAVA